LDDLRRRILVAEQYATRKDQAMSMSSRPRHWQLQWHEILNDYPDPDGGDSVTPEPLPELDADFRLQFNLWQLPREARQRAFAILPCGAEMLARVDEYLSARPEPLEPEQAITLLRTGLERARESGVQDVPSWEMHIDIVKMDTPIVQVFQHAGDPLDNVTDDLCDRARAHHGEVGWDAYFFLREPLYRLRSDYAVANWVVWPLCSSPGDADLMEASYRLSEGGWSPGWTGERLFVYDRRWERSRR
jgi:hypothetical protein